MKARKRMQQDARAFSPQQRSEIESLYQVANQTMANPTSARRSEDAGGEVQESKPYRLCHPVPRPDEPAETSRSHISSKRSPIIATASTATACRSERSQDSCWDKSISIAGRPSWQRSCSTRFEGITPTPSTIAAIRWSRNCRKSRNGKIRTNTLPAGQNILKNSGIESGDQSPDAWQQGATIDGVTYSWDKKVAFEGKASLCIEKTANRYFPIAQWSQTVDRTGDSPVLEVSAQVKAEKMTKAVLDVLFTDKDGEWISHKWVAYIGSKQAGDPPVSHDWKKYSGKVEIPKTPRTFASGSKCTGREKLVRRRAGSLGRVSRMVASCNRSTVKSGLFGNSGWGGGFFSWTPSCNFPFSGPE